MPASSGLWETVAQWIAGILAFMATMFISAVYYWTQDRFRSVHKRIDAQDKKIDENNQKVRDHDVLLARLETHMEHSAETLKNMDAKLDKAIGQ